ARVGPRTESSARDDNDDRRRDGLTVARRDSLQEQFARRATAVRVRASEHREPPRGDAGDHPESNSGEVRCPSAWRGETARRLTKRAAAFGGKAHPKCSA